MERCKRKGRIAKDSEFRNAVADLHHKNVVCFCSNGTSTEDGARYCHGHILLAYAMALSLEDGKW